LTEQRNYLRIIQLPMECQTANMSEDKTS